MPLSLDGTGSITGIGTFNFSDEIVHVGDTNTKIRFPANDTITAETNGAERLRITSAGAVGIGTDTPAGGSYLHVHGSGASDKNHIRLTADRGLIARLGDTSGSAQSMFDLYGTDGSTQIVRFISGGGDNFINTGGKLLIGRTSASHSSSTMEILGSGAEAYLRISPNTNTGTAAVVFGTADDHSTGGIYYNGSDDSLVLAGHNNDERLRIDSNGNVTKPTNFHILVQRSGNQTGYNASSTSTPIIWNSVVTGSSSSGASSHFNTSTGLFTAPVTGLYFFHIAVNCNFSVQQAWLIINGSRANYSAINPNSAATSDQSLAFYVTAGQTVGIKWYKNGDTNATINANDLHTWWRIILLG